MKRINKIEIRVRSILGYCILWRYHASSDPTLAISVAEVADTYAYGLGRIPFSFVQPATSPR